MNDCKQVLTFTQGDDSNALGGNITITITPDENTDLTGMRAVFQIADIVIDFPDISSGVLDLVLTREQTAQLPTGYITAGLKIYDAKDLARTVCYDVPCYVRAQVVENKGE